MTDGEAMNGLDVSGGTRILLVDDEALYLSEWPEHCAIADVEAYIQRQRKILEYAQRWLLQWLRQKGEPMERPERSGEKLRSVEEWAKEARERVDDAFNRYESNPTIEAILIGVLRAYAAEQVAQARAEVGRRMKAEVLAPFIALAKIIPDVIALADQAMREANRDGAEYDREAELHAVRQALAHPAIQRVLKDTA